jgi:hypothetical protein
MLNTSSGRDRTKRSRRCRWWLPLALLTLFAFSASQLGCGTLTYPQRNTNPSNVMRADVVMMNTFWLFMGLWPGLLAFWIDAKTGALYYPQQTTRSKRVIRPVRRKDQRLRRMRPPPPPPPPRGSSKALP